MFKKLKQRSLQKLTDKNLKNRDLSEINAPLKTLGFLVEEAQFEDLEVLYDFSETLGLQRKDVKVFTFLEVKKKTPSLRQNQVNNKDFTWKGEIHNQNAEEFLAIPFDALIGYYKGSNEFLDLMVAKSRAKFKIGVSESDFRLYDMIIDIDLEKTDAFKNELKKYLQVLNKI
tara:strand:+ start:33290 stop:33805 length:516 start_codon:yes stop_codon:yes gene_type:complete